MRNLQELPATELVRLLKSDDQAAFNEIYRRYWQALYAIAYNRLRDQQDAEDVVHDVLASLWTNRYKSEIENLSAYLATAAKFRVLTTIRKEIRKDTYTQAAGSDEETFDLSESLHYKFLIKMINEEVENLPERCRLVFKYSREKNLPVKEIAKQLNISTSTVENHLNNALKRLHMIMKKFSTYLFSL